MEHLRNGKIEEKLGQALWASEDLELPMSEEYYKMLHDRIMAEIAKREVMVGRESHVPWRSNKWNSSDEKGS